MAEQTWYCVQRGQQAGPITEQQLRDLLTAGQLAMTDLVWKPGMTNWQAAGATGEFAAIAAPPPSPVGVVPPQAVAYQGPPPPGVQRDIGDDAGMRLLLPVGRSGWAIAAGYLGLFSFIIFPAPLALIISAMAMWHLRTNPRLHGWGRAIFGMIMGVLGTAMLIFMVVAIAIRK